MSVLYESNLRNMIDEAGIRRTARAMHSHFTSLRKRGKEEQRHHRLRNVYAHKIREYRKAWNRIFS